MYAEIQAREFKILNRKVNTESGDLETLYKEEKTPEEELLEMFK